MFPITKKKENAEYFYKQIKKELNIFDDTEIYIPKERQLEFHIARIIRTLIKKQGDKLNYTIFMNLETGFETKDMPENKKMNARDRIDITLFYYPKDSYNDIEDEFTNEPFCEVIEVKRSGKIPGLTNKTTEDQKIILDKYFAEKFFKTKETNTIAHDFRRLVNFVGGACKIIRPKYKGEFEERYKVLGGLFIDLYSKEKKKEVIKYGVKYWSEKKKDLKFQKNLYLKDISQRIDKNKEFLSIVFFTKKKLF